jgi:hypothetical protein
MKRECENDIEKWVRMINGDRCLESSAVGFCHCDVHRGYLTKALMKQHDCLNKECTFLRKLNPAYWARLQGIEKEKRQKRADIEAERTKTELLHADIHRIIEANPHVYVTAIRVENGVLVIYYISDCYVDLRKEVRIIRDKYKCIIRLCAVRTTGEIIYKLIRKRQLESPHPQYHVKTLTLRYNKYVISKLYR